MGFGSGFSGSGKRGGLNVISGSDGQVLRFHNGSKSVIGSDQLKYNGTGELYVSGNIYHSGNIEPEKDGEFTLGTNTNTYNKLTINNLSAANVYTGDLHMKNERGDWTLFEEKSCIVVQNNLTGERFKLSMEKIEE
jgi:hypothetical protein